MARRNFCTLTVLLIISSAALGQDWPTTPAPQLMLPQGYAWLEFQISLMSLGGPTPELTDGQWMELETMMDEEGFFKLCEVLLGDFNTPSFDTKTPFPEMNTDVWSELDSADDLDGFLEDLNEGGSGLSEVLDLVEATFADDTEGESYENTPEKVLEVFDYESAEEEDYVVDSDDWEYNSKLGIVEEGVTGTEAITGVPHELLDGKHARERAGKLWSSLACNTFSCNLSRGEPGAIAAVVVVNLAGVAVFALAVFLACRKKNAKDGYKKFKHDDTLLADEEQKVPPV
ncbi:uncharacterized protein [Watersipora subatra]|uniref:uncharacterized protein n=1 Tax=Watersipora subatra TaxID=2589382 RepID=UPI00355BCB35